MGIDEIGVVINISGDTALVRMEKGEHCSSCSSRSSCLPDESSSNQKIVEAINSVGVRIGQKVQLRIESTDLIKASLLMFAIPLVFLLTGALLGKSLGQNYMESASELPAIISGLGFMGIAFLGIRKYSNTMRKRKAFFPRITKVIG